MQHKLQWKGAAQRVLITNNGTTATKTKRCYVTVTHSAVINCSSIKTYIWKIKCVKYDVAAGWSIGIHAADKAYDETYFDLRSLSYSYSADGDVRDCKRKINSVISGWKEGDILSVAYSPTTKQLCLSINDKKQAYSMNIENNASGYILAICMRSEGDCAQLMDFIEIDENDEEVEEKELTVDVKEIEVNISHNSDLPEIARYIINSKN